MSIVCLDLKKALPLSAEDVAKYSGDMHKLKAFAHGVAHAQAFNRNVGKDMPEEIVDAVLHIPEHYSIGRTGLRPITSGWAKTNYPEANYELVFTLVSNDGQAVHTLLMFFP